MGELNLGEALQEWEVTKPHKKRSFWWRDILKLIPQFKEITIIQIKNGETCMFWKDKWLTQTLQQDFFECYSFAKKKTLSARFLV